MKKFILSLFVIAAVTALTNKAYAQYAIPSYDVLVVADPTTFEETTSSNSTYITPFTKITPFSIQPVGRGERKLRITTRDDEISTNAYSTVNIYSLEGNINYGPYTIYEDGYFEIYLSTDYEWGVETLACSEGCIMDVWFE